MKQLALAILVLVIASLACQPPSDVAYSTLTSLASDTVGAQSTALAVSSTPELSPSATGEIMRPTETATATTTITPTVTATGTATVWPSPTRMVTETPDGAPTRWPADKVDAARFTPRPKGKP